MLSWKSCQDIFGIRPKPLRNEGVGAGSERRPAHGARMRNVTFLLAIGALAACGGADPANTAKPDGEEARGEAGAIDRTALEGNWIIAAFDGEPPVPVSQDGSHRAPSITFSQTGYGATAGCNALGGIGTLHGARFYTLPGAQTVMGCIGPLLAHENILDAVMRASPVVTMAADGGMTLSGGGRRLTLRRDANNSAQPDQPAPLLVGTRFQIHSIDGTYLDPRSQTDNRPLAFDALDWRATPACAMISGKWRQEGWTLRASDIAISRRNCGNDGADLDNAVRALFASDPHFSVGPNGEVLIAGGGHWIAGARDAIATEREVPALSGSWDIIGLDGRPPATFGKSDERAPRIDFGSTIYTGSTGCNSIAGNFLVRGGRLYTNPGAVTEMGCGPLTAQEDRIYALLNAAPHIGREGEDMRLVDQRGSMSIRRTNRPPGARGDAASLPGRYVGRHLTINGKYVEGQRGDPASRISISGNDVRFDVGCGEVSAVLRRNREGMSLVSNARSSEGGGCTGERLARHHLLMRLSNGPLAGFADGNGELLLAGEGVWLTARGN